MRPTRLIWRVASLSAALLWGIAATTVSAHHSFGLYDMTKASEIEGTVLKLEWSNPHCWLFVDVTSPDGANVTYGFEMTSVGEMIRRGWNKSVLREGDKVKLKFHPVRDGRPAGYLMTAMTADGHYVGRAPDESGQGAPPPAPSTDR